MSMAGRWPVLVDFQRSILDEAEVRARASAPPVNGRRPGPAKKAVLNYMFPPSPLSWQNVSRFREALAAGGRRPRVLVVGGGTVGAGGVAALYEDEGLDLVGFDVYGSPVTQFIADAHQIPLADGSVDAVVIQAVLEHVLDPWQVVQEIHRVLRKDGVVYAETPFLQQVHEGPYDFTRFTESGHRWLFRHFTAISSGSLAGPGTYLQWSVDHAAQTLFGSRRAGLLARSLFFWVRYLDRLPRAGFAVDSASTVFFLGRRAEATISPREMVGHYQGAQTRHS